MKLDNNPGWKKQKWVLRGQDRCYKFQQSYYSAKCIYFHFKQSNAFLYPISKPKEKTTKITQENELRAERNRTIGKKENLDKNQILEHKTT